MSEKTIKGAAWIQGDSLIQEQLLVVPGKDVITNTVVLVKDIWKDLTTEGTYKVANGKYFYWEYKATSHEDDDVELTLKFECPKPKEGLFKEPYDPEQVEGGYAKYWVAKLKEAQENYEYKAAIQKKEIVFPGTGYVGQDGNYVKVDEIRVKNDDLGDITNLLGYF